MILFHDDKWRFDMKFWITLLFVFTMALPTVGAQMCANNSECDGERKCLRGKCMNMNPLINTGDCRAGYDPVEVQNSNGAYLCVRSSPPLSNAAVIHQPPESPILDLDCRPNPACPEKHESFCQSGKSIAVCRPE